MDRERAQARALARLDRALAPEFAAADRVVLAFSGGLGSLVLAGLARKRGDVRCVVVGTRGSADVAAALVARDFLDYRLEVVTPRPAAILKTARALRAADPGLGTLELLDLVPLALVEDRHPRARILTGFGLAPCTPGLRRHLADRRSRSPTPVAAPTRALARRLARDLAIPEGFAAAARRSPAEGAGVGPAIRGLGHARHRSVARLLEDDVP